MRGCVWGLIVVSGMVGCAITAGLAAWAHARVSRDLAGRSVQENDEPRIWWIPFFMGILERALFTILVRYESAANVFPLMAGWLALKLAAGWQRGTPSDPVAVRARGLIAIMLTVTSLGFAFAGGLIWSGTWPGAGR